MAIQDAAAHALATVERMRSLFAHSTQAPLSAGPSLELAAQAAAGTAERASTMSSSLAAQHRGAVREAGGLLAANHRADVLLDQQLEEAAAITGRARGELDAIAARTRSLTQAAVSAATPAQQRAVLAALRAEVARAGSVVDATQRQARSVAGQIRALDYRSPD